MDQNNIDSIAIKKPQTTSNLLMIRPVKFGYNAQTAVNNAFQVEDNNQAEVQTAALKEFDDFVQKLSNEGVNVLVVEDSLDPHTPDSIFPNNWISMHADGTVVEYPMYAPNRRLERKQAVKDAIAKQFNIFDRIDLTYFEEENTFLEGTGSMVLDRENNLAYACISPRTDVNILRVFCEKLGYSPILFHAADATGMPIYHTNVLMAVGEQFIVICLDAVPIAADKKLLLDKMEATHKTVIPITYEQMNHFAGNMLQVSTTTGEKLLVMSTQAFESLTTEQQQLLSRYNRLVHSPLNNIESNGGGSARCMMAEIHLPKK